jgi:hypothetical protein
VFDPAAPSGERERFVVFWSVLMLRSGCEVFVYAVWDESAAEVRGDTERGVLGERKLFEGKRAKENSTADTLYNVRVIPVFIFAPSGSKVKGHTWWITHLLLASFL